MKTAKKVQHGDGARRNDTLVYPDDADMAQDEVSILAPIGTAMLGYQVGDIFEREVPSGKRRLQVTKILYQPEASGSFDL